MKYAAFRDLCARQWSADPVLRGDVTALHLTDAGLAELAADPAARDAAAFGRLGNVIVNPVTRSAVRLRGGAAAQVMQVTYGDACPLAVVPLRPDGTAPPPRAVTAAARLRGLAAARRASADTLRDAAREARAAGMTWQDIRAALETAP